MPVFWIIDVHQLLCTSSNIILPLWKYHLKEVKQYFWNTFRIYTMNSLFIMFLPPSLEWGLGDKACALQRTVQSAHQHLPSCGSRCPGHHPQLPTLAAQSPGEWSCLLGIKRCSSVGRTRAPGVKPHHQRAEGTLGPLPGLKTRWDHRQSHTRRLRCQTGKGQTHHHHHLWRKQKESLCEGNAQWDVCDCWITTVYVFPMTFNTFLKYWQKLQKKPLVFILFQPQQQISKSYKVYM